MTSFDDTCGVLETVLAGPTRQSIVDESIRAGSLKAALEKLRDGMRSNVWKIGNHPFDLARVIHKYDRKSRQIGFHVLHDWDGLADKVNDDTIPVDVLHYLIDKRGAEPATASPLAVLLDYYFMHLLAVLSIRIWDEGDPDANLDRVDALLAHLQGEYGSRQRFAADAETLLLIGTSHYELHERGYAGLLEKARTLSASHQLKIALGHAASMGSHLRFGFEATYGRDTVNMRNDNVADYPWLCYALATLMKEYTRGGWDFRAPSEREDARVEGSPASATGGSDQPPPRLRRSAVVSTKAEDSTSSNREPLVEAMLNGLAADARAFVGAPPASLANCERERAGFRDAFQAHRDDLLSEFEPYRPSGDTYSPLAFFFNFSHNVVKGTVIDALLRGEPWSVSFNDLLTGLPRGGTKSDAKIALATTLMAYARDNPHRIRGRLRPVIVYDIQSGREAFSVALRKLRGE
jgi:hypothetical protein